MELSGEIVRLAGIEYQAVLVVSDQFGDTAYFRADHAASAGHGFEQPIGKTFACRAIDVNVCRAHPVRHIGLAFFEMAGVAYTETFGKLPQTGSFRSAAHQEKFR